MQTQIPFFLFPGLGCTELLFSHQKEELKDLCCVIVPPWTEPQPGESLSAFAQRWGENVWENYFSENAPESQRFEPSRGCVLGGLSFGGMVSPKVGDLLQERGIPVHACFCLSTVRYGKQIAEKFRFWWNLANLLPCGGWRMVRLWCWFYLKFAASKRLVKRQVYQQILASPPRRCHRVVQMLSAWREEFQPHSFPIIQIHGTRDKILPIYFVQENPNLLSIDSGHVMSLMSPCALNEILRQNLRTSLPAPVLSESRNGQFPEP